MALGEITWTIEDGVVVSTSIDDMVQDGKAVTHPFQTLKSCFDNLPVPVDSGKYKAWLHIQEGKDFFQLLYSGKDEGERLPDKYSFYQEKLFHKDQKEYLPILHICAWKIAGSHDDFVYFPRYSSVMDSSIWNYYWCFDEKDEKDRLHLKWIIENIARNEQNGVYQLDITREYADLNARLVYESYIASKLNGHGMRISPFLFHSEWEMEKKWESYVKKKKLKSWKWRFLLIDDFAWKSMEADRPDDESLLVQKNSKLDVLKRTISTMGFTVACVRKKGENIEREGLDADVEIWGAESIDVAFQLLNDKKIGEFDIILLDYLLGPHSYRDDEFGKEFRSKSPREYGYEILKRLEAKKSTANPIPASIKTGVGGKHFFMFISAFTTAVGERLRSEGLSRNTESWYIAEGACPTNTPSLFKYSLAGIMERRISETGFYSLNENAILKEAKSIYCTSNKINPVRKKAYQSYRKILGFHYDYSNLIDYQKSSRLVASLMNKKAHMGAMLEHLLQLVHLTAFGTVRQWPEMWEEYRYFVRALDLRNKDSKDLKAFSQSIEDYIITLKSS